MSSLPFVKDHLRNQIECGGGKVYEHFEDIPKNKYKMCKLIAPHPCMTAKYVQCLAADIPVSRRNNLIFFLFSFAQFSELSKFFARTHTGYISRMDR